MTLRDHDHLSNVLILYGGVRGGGMSQMTMLKPRPTKLRSLKDTEIVQPGDVVEDMASGDRVQVAKGTFYEGVAGYATRQVKELDRVFDVLRPE